jgi:hypothetical protein
VPRCGRGSPDSNPSRPARVAPARLGSGPARRSDGKVLLLKRPLFIAAALAAAGFCWWRSRAWLPLLGGLLLGARAAALGI